MKMQIRAAVSSDLVPGKRNGAKASEINTISSSAVRRPLRGVSPERSLVSMILFRPYFALTTG